MLNKALNAFKKVSEITLFGEDVGTNSSFTVRGAAYVLSVGLFGASLVFALYQTRTYFESQSSMVEQTKPAAPKLLP